MGASVDVVVWVPVVHYPSVEVFVQEAERVGVAVKVPHVPARLRLGRSILFLAHADSIPRKRCPSCRGLGVLGRKTLSVRLLEKVDGKWRPAGGAVDDHSIPVKTKRGPEVHRRLSSAAALAKLRDETYRRSARQLSWDVVPGQRVCQRCGGNGSVSVGCIWGCCVVERVEMVFDSHGAASEYEDREVRFAGSPVVPLSCVVGGWDVEEKRQSGYRSIGGLYLTSRGDLVEVQKVIDALGGAERRGPVVMFPKMVPWEQRFVSYRYVSRGRVLKSARGRRSVSASGKGG